MITLRWLWDCYIDHLSVCAIAYSFGVSRFSQLLCLAMCGDPASDVLVPKPKYRVQYFSRCAGYGAGRCCGNPQCWGPPRYIPHEYWGKQLWESHRPVWEKTHVSTSRGLPEAAIYLYLHVFGSVTRKAFLIHAWNMEGCSRAVTSMWGRATEATSAPELWTGDVSGEAWSQQTMKAPSPLRVSAQQLSALAWATHSACGAICTSAASMIQRSYYAAAWYSVWIRGHMQNNNRCMPTYSSLWKGSVPRNSLYSQ